MASWSFGERLVWSVAFAEASVVTAVMVNDPIGFVFFYVAL